MPTSHTHTADLWRTTMEAVAPGTEFRDGLERILRGRTGALIVLGYSEEVEAMSSGGFNLDVDFSAPRLRELAKMDGAVVLDTRTNTLVRAGVQLLPDPAINTNESGTRHRTAERCAIQTGLPVIAVSQSMRIITLYVDHTRTVLENTANISALANTALATLERYRDRLNEVDARLAALEIEDFATVRDVAAVAQRQEMVNRIVVEIETYLIELGSQGRLVQLQLDELTLGMDRELDTLLADYLPNTDPETLEAARDHLAKLPATDLVDLGNVAHGLGTWNGPNALDALVSPRGFRAMRAVSRVPAQVTARVVEHFGSLQQLMAASVADLMEIDGVGEGRARTVRESLSRLVETSLNDRFR